MAAFSWRLRVPAVALILSGFQASVLIIDKIPDTPLLLS
jgi:hypothetical protein